MNITRTRKVLAAAVTGLALSAGLGLGGAGVAQAATPQPHLTCLKNLTAETDLRVDWSLTRTNHLSKPGTIFCLKPGQSDIVQLPGDPGVIEGPAGIAPGLAFLSVKATPNGVETNVVTELFPSDGNWTVGTSDQTHKNGPWFQFSNANDKHGRQMHAEVEFTTEVLN